MRILFLSDDFPPKSYGGAGMVACNLATTLAESGHQVAVITTVQERQDVGKIEFNGLKVYKLHSGYHERWRGYISIYNPGVARQVKEIISDWRPDVVHAHNIHYHLSYHSLKIAKQEGAKVFLTAHDVMLVHYGKLAEAKKVSVWSQFRKYKWRYNPFRNIIIRRYLRYVDKVFAVSHALEKALCENGIDNIVTIHNGIDVTSWQITEQEVSEFRNKFKLGDKKVVLFGGRLSGPKGGEKMIEILQKLIVQIPDTTLLVLGKIDDYAKKMAKFAEGRKIGEQLVFTGWVSGRELVAGYHASDVVAVPSLYLDPFPTVNLEAMACGKPVVGTCFGGTKEIVEDGITGFIINPFDTEESVKQIAKLLGDPSTAEKMGKAGHEKILADFTLEKQVLEVLRYYLE